MRILDRSVYVGPSHYARFPVIRLELDLGPLEAWPTGRLGRDFVDALIAALPGLAEHGCSYQEPGGFIRRMNEDQGTWLIHDLDSSAPVASVHWKLTPEGHRELLVSDVSSAEGSEGPALRSLRKADQASLLFRSKHAGKAGDIQITWHTALGSGRLELPGGEDLCWDVASNGQLDMPCPPGAWP